MRGTTALTTTCKLVVLKFRDGGDPGCADGDGEKRFEFTQDFTLSPDKGERVTSLVLYAYSAWTGDWSGLFLGFALTTLDGLGKARSWCSNPRACASNVAAQTWPEQVRVTNHVSNVYLSDRKLEAQPCMH